MHDDGRVISSTTRPIAAVAPDGSGVLARDTDRSAADTEDLAVSVMWPPNALLLAALLLSPVSRWPWYVLAILPVHVFTQAVARYSTPDVGRLVRHERRRGGHRRVSPPAAAVAARAVSDLCRRPSVPRGRCHRSHRADVILDAAVVVGTGMGQGYWDLWCHRFASNSLAMLTLVPPSWRSARRPSRAFDSCGEVRYVEAGLLALAALFVDQSDVREAPDAQASIPELTYTVLPLMFWAAVRFGPTGVSLLQLFSTCSHPVDGAEQHSRCLSTTSCRCRCFC